MSESLVNDNRHIVSLPVIATGSTERQVKGNLDFPDISLRRRSTRGKANTKQEHGLEGGSSASSLNNTDIRNTSCGNVGSAFRKIGRVQRGVNHIPSKRGRAHELRRAVGANLTKLRVVIRRCAAYSQTITVPCGHLRNANVFTDRHLPRRHKSKLDAVDLDLIKDQRDRLVLRVLRENVPHIEIRSASSAIRRNSNLHLTPVLQAETGQITLRVHSRKLVVRETPGATEGASTHSSIRSCPGSTVTTVCHTLGVVSDHTCE